MEIEKDIANLGLSEKETKVYLKALELGKASITELAKASSLKRSTVHLAVESLVMLGLLSDTRNNKRRIISAVHPNRLVELANFRANQIKEHMGELLGIYNLQNEKPKIQVFEGMAGVRLVYRELYESLNNKEEALWFTRIDALHAVPEIIGEYKKILKKLQNPKIRELNFGNAEGKKWAQEAKPYQGKNYFIRLLPTDYEFGFSDNLIFGNKLVIFSLKKNIFVSVIESEDITKTHRALFEWAWKQGEDA
jgi:sugar-specific transcriptional regulator TrmB